MNPTSRRFITAVLLVSFTGCTTWTATQAPLRELDGKQVRVTTHDHGVHEGLLMHPDTMGSRMLIRGKDPSVLLIVNSSEVTKIETRQVHSGRTVGVVALGVGIVVTIGLIWIISIFNDPDY